MVGKLNCISWANLTTGWDTFNVPRVLLCCLFAQRQSKAWTMERLSLGDVFRPALDPTAQKHGFSLAPGDPCMVDVPTSTSHTGPQCSVTPSRVSCSVPVLSVRTSLSTALSCLCDTNNHHLCRTPIPTSTSLSHVSHRSPGLRKSPKAGKGSMSTTSVHFLMPRNIRSFQRQDSME